jgi:hypothetical protein
MGWHTGTPRIVVDDVAGLVAFVRDVFGATGELTPDRRARDRRRTHHDHVGKLKARGARVEWRPLRGLTHYNVSAYVAAVGEASTWLAQVWRSAESTGGR